MPNVVPHIMLNVVDALGNDQCNALGPVWLLVIISQLLSPNYYLPIVRLTALVNNALAG